jgi:hypothetical protein
MRAAASMHESPGQHSSIMDKEEVETKPRLSLLRACAQFWVGILPVEPKKMKLNRTLMMFDVARLERMKEQGYLASQCLDLIKECEDKDAEVDNLRKMVGKLSAQLAGRAGEQGE